MSGGFLAASRVSPVAAGPHGREMREARARRRAAWPPRACAPWHWLAAAAAAAAVASHAAVEAPRGVSRARRDTAGRDRRVMSTHE